MKFRFFDGLRGLAALIVVFDHFALAFFPAAVDGDVKVSHAATAERLLQSTPLHLLVAGNFSVCIFFVLSGVVLSAKFFRTGDEQAVVASAGKRYFRLALPVLASVMIAYVLMTANAFFNTPLANATGSEWASRYWEVHHSFWYALYHGTIGVFLTGRSDNYNTVLWTMKIELIGSFLVFAILQLFGKMRHRGLIYLILGILLCKTYYVAFIMGLAICDHYFNGQKSLSTAVKRGIWLPLLLFSLFLGSSPTDTVQYTAFEPLGRTLPLGLSLGQTTHLIGAFGLIIAVLYTPWLQKLLSLKPMLYLGRVSFGLYLTHFFIIGSISSYGFIKLLPKLGYMTSFWVTVVPSLLLIWLAAHLFTRYIDEPSIRLSGILYVNYFKTL